MTKERKRGRERLTQLKKSLFVVSKVGGNFSFLEENISPYWKKIEYFEKLNSANYEGAIKFCQYWLRGINKEIRDSNKVQS